MRRRVVSDRRQRFIKDRAAGEKLKRDQARFANSFLFSFCCCLIGLAGLIVAIIALVKALENPCSSVICNLDNPCVVEECQGGICVVLQDIPGCCVNDTECNDGDECTVDLCVNNTCMNALPDINSCSFQYQCADTDTCTNCTCTETCDVAICQIEFGTPCFVTGCIEGSCEMIHFDRGCCTSNFQCTDLNLCTTDICGASNECEHIKANTTECAYDSDCGTFQFCGSNCTCVSYVPSKGECILNSDCINNLTCTINVCEKDCSCDFIPIPGCCSNDTDCIDTNPCHTNFTCDIETGLCSFSITDEDGDGVQCTVDCNDTDNTIGTSPTWFRDQDGDNDGALTAQLVACEQPEGFAQTFTDCNDNDPTIFYGAVHCNVTLLGTQFIIIPDDQQSGGAGNQQFGSALDIEGDLMAISAPGDRFLNETDNIGSVRMYRRAPELGFGNQVFVLLANITEPTISENGDEFGNSIAMSFDILVVGAQFADKNGTNSGEVFVYERTDTDEWTLRTRLFAPTVLGGSRFGISVACFNTTIVVGQTRISTGFVHVYNRVSVSEWSLTITLAASDGVAADFFGNAVAIDQDDGDPIVVGAFHAHVSGVADAGKAYVFGLVLGVWTELSIHTAPDFSTNANFGTSVDIDKGVFVVGAPFAVDSGASYVFEDNNGTWEFVKTLLSPDRQPSDDCGSSVAIKNNTILCSCPHDDTLQPETGSVNLFRTDGTGASAYSWVGKLLPVDAAISSALVLGETSRSVDVWEGTIGAGSREADVFATNDGKTYVVSCVPIPVC